MNKLRWSLNYLTIFSLIVLIGNAFAAQSKENSQELTGRIIVDGSSTVFPISEAAGEEFQKANRKVKVAVAQSGTGGGFKKFCKGEADIAGASRPIEKPEIDACKIAKIDFLEIPVAYDGITIVVSKDNTWIDSIKVSELKKIWEPESSVKNWKDIRKDFPDLPIRLFGPGHDSGTFDYFTAAINGKEKSSRKDFTASEDDNMLVRGVSGEKGALGYFGYSYFEANKSKLKALAIDDGKGAVMPTIESIKSGAYRTLSRPLYIYVSTKSILRPEVKAFANYYLTNSQVLATEVGYVALNDSVLALISKRFNNQIPGSLYENQKSRTVPLANILANKGNK